MTTQPDPENFLLEANSRKKTVPIRLISADEVKNRLSFCSPAQKNWIGATAWKAGLGDFLLVPDDQGTLDFVLCGIGKYDIDQLPPLLLGSFSNRLPDGNYHLEGELASSDIAVLGWLFGCYRYTSKKSVNHYSKSRLKLCRSNDAETIKSIAKHTYLARNLVNTPASDLGPQELENVVRNLAKGKGARVKSFAGEALLKNNFPMIHAVGRASNRAPRLIDMTWGRSGPKITLVGKGICFDTGGLNIKPSSGMLHMKKDMGGAAAAIALAGMIMDAKLKVRLRLLISAADNNISGNAFRPGDVLTSRNGMTVEIKNTDAEGRLVLADALSLADEQSPDYLVSFATLTGAARVALGPDLAPLFTDNDDFAENTQRRGKEVGDPIWRMPFWRPYEDRLSSKVADISNISEGPFAGAVTAALFLDKFVDNAATFAHFDIFAWVPNARPGRPVGGELQASRALFNYFRATY